MKLKRINLLILFIIFLSKPLILFSDEYKGLCGEEKCILKINANQIESTYGNIPITRVSLWGGGGTSRQSTATGVATTVIFGPLGLLGFTAKNHDYNFFINGYDRMGEEVSIQIKFKNDKPAKRFINEMILLTRLGMGQERSIEEIELMEKNKKKLEPLK